MPFRSAGAAFVDGFGSGRAHRDRRRQLAQQEQEFLHEQRLQASLEQERQRANERATAREASTQEHQAFENELRLRRDRRDQEKHEASLVPRQQSAARLPIDVDSGTFLGDLPALPEDAPDHRFVSNSPLGVPFERPHEAAMQGSAYSTAYSELDPKDRLVQDALLAQREMENRVEAERGAVLGLASQLEHGGVITSQEVQRLQEQVQLAAGSDDLIALHEALNNAKRGYVRNERRKAKRDAAVQAVRAMETVAGPPSGPRGDEYQQGLTALMFDPTLTPDQMDLMAGKLMLESSPLIQGYVEKSIQERLVPLIADAAVTEPTLFSTVGATTEGSRARTGELRYDQYETLRVALRDLDQRGLSEEEQGARERELFAEAGVPYTSEGFEQIAE